MICQHIKEHHLKILCPLANKDFDPSEVAIPWKVLTDNNHDVIFSTPNGNKATTDMRMLTGEGLGPFKSSLIATKDAQEAYQLCSSSQEFKMPISYRAINVENFDALLLPGGHDKGMCEYLESKLLQDYIVQFFRDEKPVAAICHGTLLAARSINPKTKKSVLFGRKTTGLTFTQELLAWLLTFLWRGNYYRTYPQFLESELKSFLKEKKDFYKGPLPIFRDQENNLTPGFTMKDENYLSARWPGDIYNFSYQFLKMLKHNN